MRVNRLFLCTIFLVSMLAGHVSAQPKGRVAPNLETPEQLDAGEGQRVFAEFRSRGIAGQFALQLELRHMPHRAPDTRYAGMLYSDWRGDPELLLSVYNQDSDATERFLLRSGPQPEAWSYSSHQQEPVKARPVTDLSAPLFAGIDITPMDLMMPFLYWPDPVYLGTSRVRGRPLHVYQLNAPEASTETYGEVASVRLMIDADFYAIIEAELYDWTGQLMKSMKVSGFKKVEDRWIIKRIDLVNERMRSKTRFDVTAASFQPGLQGAVFEPAQIEEALPVIPPDQWTYID